MGKRKNEPLVTELFLLIWYLLLINKKLCVYLPLSFFKRKMKLGSGGREARQRSAKPRTAVRIRLRPHKTSEPPQRFFCFSNKLYK